MLETEYSKVKVHNEIELCEVEDLEIKERLEKELLKNRISYYLRWTKPRLFGRNKNGTCIFCVNEAQREVAEAAIKELGFDSNNKVKFIMKKVDKIFY